MEKIRLEHVSYVYGAGTPYEIHALNDVSLSVEEGLITGIIGHTGSGKSTLVQLLNGLSKPENGTVFLDGQDIWEKPKEIGKIRFRVGLVMQYPEYQLFEETVSADIAYGPKNLGLSDDEVKERVAEAARIAGIDTELLEKSPFDLSGGQKRRVAIAGIIAMRPEVLVLDEPAAGLDPIGRETIMNHIRKYRDETGATVIIVSHSMEDMAVYCDRIIVMSEGKVFLTGEKAQVFSHAKELEAVGLDVPQVTRTMQLLRDRGIAVPEGIFTVEEAVRTLSALFDGKRGGNR